MAKQQGIIETWKANEGFGFIQPDGGGKDHFFHVSEIAGGRKPAVGQRVSYSLTQDSKGRLRAENIRFETQRNRETPRRIGLPNLPTGGRLAGIGPVRMILFALPLGLATVNLMNSWLPLAVYLVASLIGATAITLDKRFAQEKLWRIPEATLHLIEIVGGWPGSGVAQQVVRHKTQKLPYQVTFWAIAAVHLLFWADWLLFDLRFSQMIGDLFA